MGVDRVMQLRAQILERNQALSRANSATAAPAPAANVSTSFASSMEDALKAVNEGQNKASEISAA